MQFRIQYFFQFRREPGRIFTELLSFAPDAGPRKQEHLNVGA